MSLEASVLLGVLAGLAVGAAVVWGLYASRIGAAQAALEAERAGREGALETERAGREGALLAKDEALRAKDEALRAKDEERARAEALMRAEVERARKSAEEERARAATELARAAEAQAALRESVAQSDERERALAKRIEEQQRFMDESRKALEDAFKARGAEALEASQKAFLANAKSFFEQQTKAFSVDTDQKQKAIDELVKPVREALERQEKNLQEFDSKRAESFAAITKQIEMMVQSGDKLRDETTLLVGALRRPEQRGRWGELQLRNCVELAGMTEHCDFDEQLTVRSEDGALRPDLVVKLPGRDSVIVVDSKVALDAWLDMLLPDADREACLARHASAVQKHWQGLARKEYWNALKQQGYRTPELVVMFVPVESALTAAMERLPEMHAEAMRNHVLIVTPTLLVALLRSVAYGWQQQDLAVNAQRIADEGANIYERLRTFCGHLSRVGRSLRSATEAYNHSVGSLEKNLLPSARRMQELKITIAGEMGEPESLEVETREITALELLPQHEITSPELPPHREIEGKLVERVLGEGMLVECVATVAIEAIEAKAGSAAESNSASSA